MAADLKTAASEAATIRRSGLKDIRQAPFAVEAPGWQPRIGRATAEAQSRVESTVNVAHSVGFADGTAGHSEVDDPKATESRPVCALGIAGWSVTPCTG